MKRNFWETAKVAAWGRYLQKNFQGTHSNSFREFLFSPGATLSVANPWEAGLPLVTKLGPNDQLLFRNSWEEDASWGVFSGQGGVPADHAQPDTGHFGLMREGQFLTRDAAGYKSFAAGSQTYNVLAIENDTEHGSPRMTGFDTAARLARWRTSDSPLLAYAMLDADGQYDDNPDSWEPVSRVDSYRRHFIWFGDHVVVMDRLRTTDSGWSMYRLRAESEPQLDGDTLTLYSADGQQMLVHRTLEPAGCSIEIHDEETLFSEFPLWEIPQEMRNWQSHIRPPDSENLEMLSVMKLGPQGMSGLDDNLQHIAGADNCGAVTGPLAVALSREEILRSSCSYLVNSPQAGMWHLIGDLEPGSYTVHVNGLLLGSFTAATQDNTLLFQTGEDDGPLSIEVLHS